MSERLSLASLAASGRSTAIPRDTLDTGIVHLGVGAFARGHTAVFTERAMIASDDPSWGIVGVTQQSPTAARQLAPQDGLFTVLERGGTAEPAIVSSIVTALDGTHQADAVSAAIADPRTRVVTITITEKGYSGGPAVGRLVDGLAARRRAEAGPLTVVSCDNLPANGRVTRDAVLAIAEQRGDGLADGISSMVRFPNTMVDRMVPATTDADLDEVERLIGLRDEAAVGAEPFLQWVIEDDFAAERPRWEAAGAILTDDVAPWEAAKLRLLNASHTLLAQLGALSGRGTIAETIAVDGFRAATIGLIDEALTVLRLPAELDGGAYRDSLLGRFGNRALGHSVAKVGADTSQKIGPRILSTARDLRAAGRDPRWASLAIAAWIRRLATADASDLSDPLAPVLVAAAGAGSAADRIERVLGIHEVFGDDLPGDRELRADIADWYARLERDGADGLGRELARG